MTIVSKQKQNHPSIADPSKSPSKSTPPSKDEEFRMVTRQIVVPSTAQMHPVFQLEEYLQRLLATRVESDNINHSNHNAVQQPGIHEDKRDEIFRVVECLFGNTLVQAALSLLDNHESLITKISTISRSLWLVRGSSDVAYMCFACDETPNLYYCSCRSFLEKTSKMGTTNQALPEFCKHLLAIKLVNALRLDCPHLILPDNEFTKLILDRTMKNTY